MNPLESAQAELKKLRQERVELDRKIEAVQQAIKIFEPVYEPLPTVGNVTLVQLTDGLENLGITAAIERVLMANHNTAFSPTAIRDMLVEAKFKLVGDNPMASIHQILKRLVARKEKIVADVYDGLTVYRYDPSITPGEKSLTPPMPPPRTFRRYIQTNEPPASRPIEPPETRKK